MPAFEAGHVASMIGVEGLHQIDGSIAAIREVHELGARYITLTHNCNNVLRQLRLMSQQAVMIVA
jgi:membrane dipeptidase